MRLTDHSENPILSTCLAWFGGGGSKGPSKQDQQAAQAQQAQMEQAAAQQAAQQQQQLELQRQQMEAQRKAQEDMVKQMEANKPAPAAQVDAGNAKMDVAANAARRRGLRRSILAGDTMQPAAYGTTKTLG